MDTTASLMYVNQMSLLLLYNQREEQNGGKDLQAQSDKYTQNHPEVYRDTVQKYTQSHPEIHRDAIQKYTQSHPEIHRDAVQKYTQSHLEVNREAVRKYTQRHPEVNRKTVKKYVSKNPHVARTKSNKYKEKISEIILLPWTSKHLSAFKYKPNVDYSMDEIVNLGPRLPCSWCRALKWKDETQGMCCSGDKVQLPNLEPYPEPLHSLLTHQDPLSEHFLSTIRKCFRKETQTGEDGYPQYRRRSPENGGIVTQIKENNVDNRWFLPYNPVLSRTFNAHINVEFCNSVKSIKYICKYVNKGTDQATFGVEDLDEVTRYESGRYISSSEAVWRILCFPIHERFPPAGVVQPSFQAACRALGLLEDDTHRNNTLEEASISESPNKIRELFAIILVFCQVGYPIKLWEKHRDSLAEDIKKQFEAEKVNIDLYLDIVYNQCFILLEDIVISMSGKALLQFRILSPSREAGFAISNHHYRKELAYYIHYSSEQNRGRKCSKIKSGTERNI
ncbi:ATP-dependent DNA helicase [Trichonephila clavata]|uniref:ATP-dependent DNA helicase n=1 Tax=Trichonephila clavata TaxID=2740835 RepID=A0A8X6H5Y7_TRICU|nr:ATP-dependent DNA helicase [Trichonephila clavata]